MSFLSDAISQAESQIKVNTSGQINGVKQSVSGTISNIKNTGASAVSGAVNNVVKSGIGAVTGAVGDLLSGNVSGAVGSILGAPSNILNSALSGLGGSGGSANLAGPGNFSATSSTNGIDPGNSLAGALARPDPMMNFTWYAQLPVISPGTTQSAINSASSSVLSNLQSAVFSGISNTLTSAMGGAVSTSGAAQLPWYYVEEATCPFREFQSKSIFREGRERNYPEKYSVSTLRLAIYSDSQNQAFTYLQAWNNAIITPFSAATSGQLAGGWGRPSDYKKSIYIYLLDVTKSVVAIVQYTECWPISVEAYSMGSGNAERVINHVTFSVGDVFINLLPISPNVLSSVIANGANNAVTSLISGSSNLISSLGSGLKGLVASTL